MLTEIIVISVLVGFILFVGFKLFKKEKPVIAPTPTPLPVEPPCSKPEIFSVDDLGNGAISIDFAYPYCNALFSTIEISQDNSNWELSEVHSYVPPIVIEVPESISKPFFIRMNLQDKNGQNSDWSESFLLN